MQDAVAVDEEDLQIGELPASLFRKDQKCGQFAKGQQTRNVRQGRRDAMRRRPHKTACFRFNDRAGPDGRTVSRIRHIKPGHNRRNGRQRLEGYAIGKFVLNLDQPRERFLGSEALKNHLGEIFDDALRDFDSFALEPRRLFRRRSIAQVEAQLAVLTHDAMTRTFRRVLVLPHKFANPPRRRPQTQRVGQISVSRHTARGNLCQQPRQFRDQIGNFKITIHETWATQRPQKKPAEDHSAGLL